MAKKKRLRLFTVITSGYDNSGRTARYRPFLAKSQKQAIHFGELEFKEEWPNVDSLCPSLASYIDDEIIRKAYAALPDNAIVENDQLKAKLAETAKDLIYARNEAVQTRLQLEELEKKFVQSRLNAIPTDPQKGFKAFSKDCKVVTMVPTMKEIELQGQVTAQGQEIEVLRSQLVRMEQERDEVHHALIPLYSAYRDLHLPEIVSECLGHEYAIQAAFRVARADGYKGDSLEEFAQHVIITRQAAEAEARAYEGKYDHEIKFLEENIAIKRLECVDLINDLDMTHQKLAVQEFESNDLQQRLASAEDSLRFFSDLQAFPPYAEYLVSVPDGTEPMTFPVWLNGRMELLAAWENNPQIQNADLHSLVADKDRWDWLEEQKPPTVVGWIFARDIDTPRSESQRTSDFSYANLLSSARNSKCSYPRTAREAVDAARNPKAQETEFDEEIPE